jgi:hypothetical protein
MDPLITLLGQSGLVASGLATGMAVGGMVTGGIIAPMVGTGGMVGTAGPAGIMGLAGTTIGIAGNHDGAAWQRQRLILSLQLLRGSPKRGPAF